MSDDTGESMAEYEEMWGLLHEMRPVITSDSEWQTARGEHVKVRAMGDGHLLNTINVLREKSPIGTRLVMDHVTRSEWLNVMANEAYARGLTIPEVDEKDPVHE